MGDDLSLSTFSTDKIANRIETTERLLKGIQISDDERLFLRMAAQLKDSWSETTSTVYSSKILVHALGEHSKALVQAAESTDRNTKSLTFATWILAVATVILAIATIGLWIAARN